MDKITISQIKAIRSLYPSLFERYEFHDSEILALVSRCPDFSYRLYLLENMVKAFNFFRDCIIPKGDKKDIERLDYMASALYEFVYSMTDGVWLPF